MVDFESGENLAKEIIKDNTKAIICFSESMKSAPQDFLEGFDSLKNNIIVAGGTAGDNGDFKKTFVIFGDKVYDKGIVLCSLNSDKLIVKNHSVLDWIPVGRDMTITKCDKNIVYEINNTPILELYKYYFGEDIEEGIPMSIIEFPLVKVENNIEIARLFIGYNKDKSFTFGGHFSEGDKVRFSVGVLNEIISSATRLKKSVNRHPSEAIFVYSCFGRKQFIGEKIFNEISDLNKIAPTSGFFTYGEFFNTGKSNQILNITTTILSLSESSTHCKTNYFYEREEKSSSMLKSLTHLVNVTELELEENIKLLQNTQNELIESKKMAALGALVSGISHEINTPLGVGLSGISQIQHEVRKRESMYHDEDLGEEDLLNNISITKRLADTIHNSLDNAAKLVASFKHVSVDQHSNDTRVFSLKEYVDEVIFSHN